MEFRLHFAEIEEAGDVVPVLLAPAHKQAGMQAYADKGVIYVEARSIDEADLAAGALDELASIFEEEGYRLEVICPECGGTGEVVAYVPPASPLDVSPPDPVMDTCDVCGGSGAYHVHR